MTDADKKPRVCERCLRPGVKVMSDAEVEAAIESHAIEWCNTCQVFHTR